MLNPRGISACLMIYVLLVVGQGAIALDTTHVIGEIREKGTLDYVRGIMENSPALQYSFSPRQKNDMMNIVAAASRGKLIDIKASQLLSVPGYELTILEIAAEENTNILILSSASERSDSVFELTFVNLDEGGLAQNSMRYNDALPPAEMEVSVVDETRKALDNMFQKKEGKYMDDLERLLAGRARVLPPYVSKRLASHDDQALKELSRWLQSLPDANGEFKYLGTKNLLGQHRISLFAMPTNWGPAVCSLHFVVLDTGPVVADLYFALGVVTAPYFNDYRRVFSGAGRPISSEGMK